MIDWTEIVKQAMGIFTIVDPIGTVGIFLAITDAQTAGERRRTALIANLTMAIVLVTAILVGEKSLGYFGIGIPEFQVGGGIILLLLSISMLNARMPGLKRTEEEEKEAADKDTIAVVPMGIPLLAGPGSISMVIIDSHTAQSNQHIALLVGIVLIIAFITWLTFRMAIPISSYLGKTGLNIVTRLMGLLLAAISVGIIADGLKGLFPALS